MAICSGSPYNAVICVVLYTSSYSENASTTIMNFWPMNGPAKSMWSLFQTSPKKIPKGVVALGVACFALADTFHTLCRSFQCPCQYVATRHTVVWLPGCPLWISLWSTAVLSFAGVITPVPHSTYPCSTESSSRFLWYPLNSSGIYFAHPAMMNLCSFESSASFFVTLAICFALSSTSSRCSR